MKKLTRRDLEAVESFRNFLSWGHVPGTGLHCAPPAVFAYVLGVTTWCPPVGEW